MANFTPQQVTDLLKKCSVSHICAGCPLEGMHKCDEELMKMAAEGIEELAAMVLQWISVQERYPDKELEEVLETPDDGSGMYRGVECLVKIRGASRAATAIYADIDGDREFVDEELNWYPVTHWMPMPGI